MNIVVLTADLKYSNRTVDFERRHPERFFNVGIAEQHMVSMAAGMATFGFMPYVATFATFVGLLCAEQLRTDLAYPGLPVRVLAHHAGIALGFYGTSHHATEDLGVLRSMAGMTVICPCDATAPGGRSPTPSSARGRYTSASAAAVSRTSTTRRAVQVGRLAELRSGDDLTIVANGSRCSALDAADWPRGHRGRGASMPTRCVRLTRTGCAPPSATAGCW